LYFPGVSSIIPPSAHTSSRARASAVAKRTEGSHEGNRPRKKVTRLANASSTFITSRKRREADYSRTGRRIAGYPRTNADKCRENARERDTPPYRRHRRSCARSKMMLTEFRVFLAPFIRIFFSARAMTEQIISVFMLRVPGKHFND